jgi:oxalate decarboxylase/phosphoglucose isomerase-like protein (cupin superfamily)
MPRAIRKRTSLPQGLGRILHKDASYPSKSGGKLHVMLQLDKDAFMKFFKGRKTLRIYRVSDVPKGGVGAAEFHKRRSEIITVEKGSFKLLLEDLHGKRKSFILTENMTFGVIPPYTFHTYIAVSNKAALHVLANTLYNHKDSRTYDTYSKEAFQQLQSIKRH